MNASHKIYWIIQTIRSQGIVAGWKFALVLFLKRDVYWRPNGFAHSVLVRGDTSDAVVAYETFVKKEYKTPHSEEFRVILDLGGNVGYTAVFFAHHYPEASIVSLEPDEANFQCLLENTKSYANITPVNRAVWWRDAQLKVINPQAESWSFQCQEVEQGGLTCISIDKLLEEHGSQGGIMVKMDIEGAEQEIFEQTSEWLKKTSCLQLEIHNCWKAVFDRLAAFSYKASISGQTVIIDLMNENPRQPSACSAA